MDNPTLQESLLRQRYLLRDKNGKVIETIDKMFRRVAHAVAQAEKLYQCPDETVNAIEQEFHQIMSQGLFLPNSPTLMNAGRENGMLSGCFVLPIADSIEGIFSAVSNTALIQRAGGGTGFSFDALRPTGDIVASSGGKTSGPISFWKVFAQTTSAIQQGAHRRGANMAMMSVTHPDILKFINAKSNLNEFSNFNISVKVTDEFMKGLYEYPDVPHRVTNPRTEKSYLLPGTIDIDNYSINDLVPAGETDIPCHTTGEVWAMIVKNAHATGEPGVCFIDHVNKNNPTPNMGRIEALNACGEQPLLDYESCNLGSIDISKLVLKNGGDLNWKQLGSIVYIAVRFLDDVINANHYPIPETRLITHLNRKIGLGIMGFADALILLGIRYDSQEAVDLAGNLAAFIQKTAHQASEKLAWEKGRFPNFNGSIWDKKNATPMRNASCTTIAPTGSISILAGCSNGIEPVFKFAYERTALDDRKFMELHPLIERLGTNQSWLNDSVREKLLKGTSPALINEIPQPLSRLMVTAHQVSPQWHVKIQAAFQAHTDSAVSKTVNLPANAPTKDIDGVFRLAYKLGCKGITVYRDQARQDQVFKGLKSDAGDCDQHSLKPRQRITIGQTAKYRIGCGTLFVTVNKDENGLCEVFANLGKAGGCPSQSEATCRAVSAALRSGVRPEVLIEQLKDIRCLSTIAGRKTNKDIDVLSCPDAIAIALQEALGKEYQPREKSHQKKCPNCGHPLRKEAGCYMCDNCKVSDCG